MMGNPPVKSNLTETRPFTLISLDNSLKLVMHLNNFFLSCKKRSSPYINRFLQPDTIVPGAANPQAWNRYSYVLGNPLRYTDPTGHGQCQTQEDCDDMGTTPMGGGSSPKKSKKSDHKKDKPIDEMKPGDIITFEVTFDGESVTYNYMLGITEDNKLGFWDLDAHTYVTYALTVSMVDGANSWTTFKKMDPKTFNSYEVMNSSGAPATSPGYDVDWTGGMDSNPAYVEIRTQVDWENVPSQFSWAVLGPSLVTSFWGDAKPTVTPLSPGGYFPLTNYVAALLYFAKDGAAVARYPVIHP